jgi:pyruvate ferredoxin oxidoreductase gamma subunit
VKQIKFYGRGGQGVVTGAKMMVYAANEEDKYAQALPSFGHERRGAPVYAYARLDEQQIPLKSFVYDPECVILFDPHIGELGVDFTEGAVPGCILVANGDRDWKELTKGKFGKIGWVDAIAITREEIGDVPPNAAMMGAFCAVTGWLSLDSLCKSLQKLMPGQGGEKNVRAAKRAYNEVKTISL